MKDDQFQLLVKLIEANTASLNSFKDEVERRFDGIEKRIEGVDRRIDDSNERIKSLSQRLDEYKDELRDIKYDVRADRDKLQEVYESRDRVTVNFTRSWMTASFFIALIASTIVLSIAKAF